MTRATLTRLSLALLGATAGFVPLHAAPAEGTAPRPAVEVGRENRHPEESPFAVEL
jgi:hypothetical protein